MQAKLKGAPTRIFNLVSYKATLTTEGFVTHIALIRFILRMFHLVSYKLTFTNEDFASHIFWLRFILTLIKLLYYKASFTRDCHDTTITLIRFISRMYPVMFYNVIETLATLITWVRSFVNIYTCMCYKRDILTYSLATLIPIIWFITYVYPVVR